MSDNQKALVIGICLGLAALGAGIGGYFAYVCIAGILATLGWAWWQSEQHDDR